VKSKDKENVFYKNTLEVTPNPSLLFGSNMYNMFYYFEIYNLNKDQLGENYIVNYTIIDSKGVEDFTETKSYKVLSSTKVEFGSIDLSRMTTDKYKLIVSLKTESGTFLDSATKIFYVYNPKVKDDELNQTSDNAFLLSEFVKYSDKQINNDYEKMIYVINDLQKEQFEKLSSLDAKRLFMYNFWKMRNADPSKARKEYFTRVDYANKNFRNDFFPGWRSDMGRVYILYGAYSDIERHEFESQTKAYQIWFYNNIQGGAQFVFVDQSSGVGNFVLVHSTVQNEIRNDSWRDDLDIRK
jgi:GWxTD domain-containing protein